MMDDTVLWIAQVGGFTVPDRFRHARSSMDNCSAHFFFSAVQTVLCREEEISLINSCRPRHLPSVSNCRNRRKGEEFAWGETGIELRGRRRLHAGLVGPTRTAGLSRAT